MRAPGRLPPTIGLLGPASVRLVRLPAAGDTYVDQFPLSSQEFTVAAVCDICAKGPGFGHNVSFSHRRTNRRFNPNIQRVRAVVNGTPKRLYVCTSCLK